MSAVGINFSHGKWKSEVSTRFSLWCVLSLPLSLTHTQNDDEDDDEDDVYDYDDAKPKEYNI